MTRKLPKGEVCMQWNLRVFDRLREQIVVDFEYVLSSWLAYPGNDDPDRAGCVGSVFLDATGDLAMPQVFLGKIPEGKVALYAFYSMEKGIRLGAHPGDVTSAASALTSDLNSGLDVTDKKYPGAVRCPRFLRFSVSGFSGAADQALSTAMLDRSGMLTEQLLDRIETESGSTLAREFVVYDREHRPH